MKVWSADGGERSPMPPRSRGTGCGLSEARKKLRESRQDLGMQVEVGTVGLVGPGYCAAFQNRWP